MNTNTSRRAAASCGALALLLGVGALVPLSAQASGTTIGGATTGVGSAVSGVGSALAGTPAPSASTGLVDAVVATVTSTTSTAPTSAATGSSTSVLDVAAVNTGSAATPTSGVVTVPGVVSVGSDLLGSTGSGTGSGTGTGGAGGAGGGGITVSLGNGADGGSLATAGTGGNAGTSGSAGGTSTTSTTTNSSTTNTYGTGTPAASAPTASASPAAPAATPAAAAPVRLVGLGATPSIGTVYPVKDGYRDDVVFRVASRTSSTTAKAAVTGSAVLMRGTKAVAQWSISQPTQDLRWNGLDHGKLVPGDYVLSATVQDAAGTTHSTTARVVASAKRLVPSVQRVNALSTTGTHTMAAAARAGLSKGTVTLRLTTVATKVVGKHFLIFVKGAKQFRVPITRGTHTTKAVVVPKAFTSYTLKHTWKKGQVTLKSIRYTYSYQSLR